MKNIFKTEHLEQIRKARSNASNTEDFHDSWDIDDLIAELTKSEWLPADGQGYINDEGGMYRVSGCHDIIG